MEMTLNKAVAPLPERSPGYWTTVCRRLLRNKLAMLAALILIALVLTAIFAPALMPADPYASSILKRLKPIGFDGHLLGTDELGRDMLSRLMLAGGCRCSWVSRRYCSPS
jgi:peptide/nickel transport system permease protein